MKKVKVVIEMDMPLLAEDISLKELRKIHREFVTAQGCSVEIVFMLNAEQRRFAERLPGYVARKDWSDGARMFYPKDDIGACETFRFRPHAL